jgi:hypothetical protein
MPNNYGDKQLQSVKVTAVSRKRAKRDVPCVSRIDDSDEDERILITESVDLRNERESSIPGTRKPRHLVMDQTEREQDHSGRTPTPEMVASRLEYPRIGMDCSLGV